MKYLRKYNESNSTNYGEIMLDVFIMDIVDKWNLKEYDTSITSSGSMLVSKEKDPGHATPLRIFRGNGWIEYYKNERTVRLGMYIDIGNRNRDDNYYPGTLGGVYKTVYDHEAKTIVEEKYPGLYNDIINCIKRMKFVSEQKGGVVGWRDSCKEPTISFRPCRDFNMVEFLFYVNIE